LKVVKILSNENIECGVFHIHNLKPFDHVGLQKAAENVDVVISIEEHVLNGGLGSIILESFSDNGLSKKVIRLGIPDIFSEKYGSQDILMEKYGLNSENIIKVTQEYLSNNN